MALHFFDDPMLFSDDPELYAPFCGHGHRPHGPPGPPPHGHPGRRHHGGHGHKPHGPPGPPHRGGHGHKPHGHPGHGHHGGHRHDHGRQELSVSRAGRKVLVDVQEDDKQFQVEADFPGIAKEHIKLYVDGRKLTLAAEGNTQGQGGFNGEGDVGSIRIHCNERSAGFAKRSLYLPERADMINITASHSNGVLKIIIPKHEGEEDSARIITIE